MPDYQDPFEAYRARKKADKDKKEVPKAAEALPPSEDGRPRGFASHRLDFGKDKGAPPPAPAEPPKGFESGKLGKLKHVDPGQKPKGFGKDRLGPGPKAPPAPPDDSTSHRKEE